MDKRIQPSAKGQEIADRWLSQNTRIESLLKQLDTAREEAAITAKALSDWLKPKDAKPNETFHLWVGSTLLEFNNDTVKIRAKE